MISDLDKDLIAALLSADMPKEDRAILDHIATLAELSAIQSAWLESVAWQQRRQLEQSLVTLISRRMQKRGL